MVLEIEFLLYIVVGFLAQIIDGALGMGYGVTTTTVLLSLGISPAAASASVHTAEVFTSGASGLAHLRFGNVDRSIFKKLVIPGIIGGVLGAYVLTTIPGDVLRPYVAAYLLLMGVVILVKTRKRVKDTEPGHGLLPLGFFGGFLDAIGGGGWGPIVTSSLVARGNHPRFAIGSANLAEFFVTVAVSATFILTIGVEYWNIVLGLIIGGVIAAPLAAHICGKIPSRALMIIVGILVILLSVRILALRFV